MATMLVRLGRTATATLLSLAVAAGLVSFPAAAQAATQPDPDPTAEQPFAATSGDSCRYGQAKGGLGWRLPPLGGPPIAVDVSGTLADRPTAPITIPECGDDRRFSVLTVSAYSGGLPIATELVRVDNGIQRFAFQLPAETRRAPIELVVLYICRHSLATGELDYCGPRQVFRAPVSI
jgi:hypothetical protein